MKLQRPSSSQGSKRWAIGCENEYLNQYERPGVSIVIVVRTLITQERGISTSVGDQDLAVLASL